MEKRYIPTLSLCEAFSKLDNEQIVLTETKKEFHLISDKQTGFKKVEAIILSPEYFAHKNKYIGWTLTDKASGLAIKTNFNTLAEIKDYLKNIPQEDLEKINQAKSTNKYKEQCAKLAVANIDDYELVEDYCYSVFEALKEDEPDSLGTIVKNNNNNSKFESRKKDFKLIDPYIAITSYPDKLGLLNKDADKYFSPNNFKRTLPTVDKWRLLVGTDSTIENNILDKNVAGIYAIVNSVSGQLYIGKAVKLLRRSVEHKSARTKDSKFLHAAINYAKEHSELKINFYWGIIETLNTNEDILDEAEKRYIKYYDTYNNDYDYNLTPGGEGVGHTNLTDFQIEDIKTALKNAKENLEKNNTETTLTFEQIANELTNKWQNEAKYNSEIKQAKISSSTIRKVYNYDENANKIYNPQNYLITPDDIIEVSTLTNAVEMALSKYNIVEYINRQNIKNQIIKPISNFTDEAKKFMRNTKAGHSAIYRSADGVEYQIIKNLRDITIKIN